MCSGLLRTKNSHNTFAPCEGNHDDLFNHFCSPSPIKFTLPPPPWLLCMNTSPPSFIDLLPYNHPPRLRYLLLHFLFKVSSSCFLYWLGIDRVAKPQSHPHWVTIAFGWAMKLQIAPQPYLTLSVHNHYNPQSTRWLLAVIRSPCAHSGHSDFRGHRWPQPNNPAAPHWCTRLATDVVGTSLLQINASLLIKATDEFVSYCWNCCSQSALRHVIVTQAALHVWVADHTNWSPSRIQPHNLNRRPTRLARAHTHPAMAIFSAPSAVTTPQLEAGPTTP